MAYRPIFFDTETTGVNSERDRIIEIAAYDPYNKKSFEALIYPGMPIPRDTTLIHGITDEMVKDAHNFAKVGKDFADFCAGDAALIAHNNDAFDLPFLRAEFGRSSLEIPSQWLFIDSLKWARRYRKDLPRHSLQYLRQSYGIKENKAHRALNDVMVLYEVFTRLIDDLSCEDVVRLMQGSQPTQTPKAQVKKAVEQETYLLFK
jgi:DNA polymerase III subunit epsilon